MRGARLIFRYIKMKTFRLPDGHEVPALGQGTWRMGEDKSRRADEAAALRLGIDLGMTLIDTAEMYGEGEAEKVVAEAIKGQRDRVFIVTKVYPHNATRTEMPKACERSLKRLRIDSIDLYLLHWRENNTRLAEAVETFERLLSAGKIRWWGVSNFDVDDMKELLVLSHTSPCQVAAIAPNRRRASSVARPRCSANQVLYNLENRGIEFDLLPWSEAKNIPIMAYAPVGHGRGLLQNATLRKIADRHGETPAQIALAWVLARPKVVAIPKATNPDHVRDNAAASEIRLTIQDRAELDDAFPPPRSKQPLAML